MGDAGSFVLPTGTVAFLLTDVAGSTRLWESDPEQMGPAIVRHYEILDAAIAAHGGVRPVEQGEGDSVVAAFSRASDAVAAAAAAQIALSAESWPTTAPLRVRMAIHCGEARLRNAGNYVGQAIIRTARLRAVGHGGQVLVSAAARDLAIDRLGDGVELSDLGVHRLKDLGRPEHVYQLIVPGVPCEFPPLLSLDAHPNNLPAQMSSWVGRLEAIATLGGLLGDHRLVTLTGPGGAGKSRLALHVAADALERFRDGAWLVELAPVTDPSAAVSAIRTVLGLPDTTASDPVEAFASTLADSRLLLLLDNCEHLVGPVATIVDRLLTLAPDVQVMATSRIALGVPGEVAWSVPPLHCPALDDDPLPVEQIGVYDAVRLFVERAAQVRTNFRIDTHNAPVVAEICVRLDGIPLAIELAAARCRSLTPQRILGGLNDALPLLTGGARTVQPRQQTLEATIAWSHDLLSDVDRVLLRRLSVFAGGFTLDAAEAVAPADPLPKEAVLDGLDRLVVQSMLAVDTDAAEPRYRMLETVRQFAARRLEQAAERDTTVERHRDWVVEVLRQLGEALIDDAARVARRQLVVEWPNVAAAVERAGSRRVALICEITKSMWADAEHPAFSADLIAWTDEALSDEPPVRAVVYGCRALAEAGRGAWGAYREDLGLARHHAELEGDLTTLARVLMELSIEVAETEPELGIEYLDQAAQIAAATHDRFVLVRIDLHRIETLHGAGRLKELRQFLHGHTITSAYSRAGIPFHLALCAYDNLDYEAALGYLEEDRRGWFGDSASDTTASTDSVAAMMAVDRGEPPPFDLDDAFARARRRAESSSQSWYGNARTLWLEATDRWSEVVEACKQAIVEGYTEGLELNWAAWKRATLAVALAHLNDAAAAETEIAHAERILGTRTCPQHQTQLHLARAEVDILAGRYETADQAAHRALSLAVDEGFRRPGVLALERLAAAAAGLDRSVEAARLWGAAAALRDQTGFRYRAPACPVDAQHLAEAIAQGRSTTYDEAVAYARRARGERRRPSHGWSSLTPTERRVAELVADGLTNTQVAERLLMSRETVKTHVSHILTKLGAANRTDLGRLVHHHRND